MRFRNPPTSRRCRGRSQKFPCAASLRMALSRERFATSFFSRRFSCSSSRSRFACSLLRPPYSFRQQVVGLFCYAQLPADLGHSQALSQPDLRLSQRVDDLLCRVTLPTQSFCPLSLLQIP